MKQLFSITSRRGPGEGLSGSLWVTAGQPRNTHFDEMVSSACVSVCLGEWSRTRDQQLPRGVLEMKIGRASDDEPESTMKLALAFQGIIKEREKWLSFSSVLSPIYPTSHKRPYKAVIGLEGKFKRDGMWKWGCNMNSKVKVWDGKHKKAIKR